MTGTGPLVAFLVVVASVGAFCLLVFRWMASQERRRHRNNRDVAQRMGWSYLAKAPFLAEIFESPPFRLGSNRRVTDAVQGMVRGREFIAFGYHYETGLQARDIHDLRVCVVRVPGVVPLVRISPESQGSRVAVALGGTDVEVESEEFNRWWRVWSPDIRVAHAILTPTMIDRLLKNDVGGCSILFEPGFVALVSEGYLDLEYSPLPIDTVSDLADLIPKYLADDHT